MQPPALSRYERHSEISSKRIEFVIKRANVKPECYIICEIDGIQTSFYLIYIYTRFFFVDN